jgi:hypothetical protein
MPTLKEEIKQNKPTWIWRGSLMILFALLSFLGSWLFNEVSAMPKEYVNKVDQRSIDERQDRKQEALEKKIDQGFKDTQQLILDLHK